MMKSWHIRGGRVVDPLSGRDEVRDLFLQDGIISPLQGSVPAGTGVIDARGLIVAPGLVDLHVHLREPGGEDSETIASGSAAAAHGGFTTIVAMPNTNPAADTPDAIVRVMRRGENSGLVRVLPAGCITKERKGLELADLKGMREAGAVAFTDDGATVTDDGIMRAAMSLARGLGVPVMDHALDSAASARGAMHEGAFSSRLNLPGIPSSAEADVVERDILLAAETSCRVHIQHVSAMESVASLRRAAEQGLPVTCEVTPHHLALTDADVRPDDAVFKVSPPLRAKADRDALMAGVASGVFTAFATDHAPHTILAKKKAFLSAPCGMIGLETAAGVTYSLLVKSGMMGLAQWLKMWTSGPANVLGLKPPRIQHGYPADLVLLDLASEWTVYPEDFLSKSRNTPFGGWSLTGRAVCTICDGVVTWDCGDGRVDKCGRI